ncbi:MAG: GFA family protein [Rhodospirillaceae bacterium]|nr:GFA family protein [Rhodospirillaceae bacterium]
MTGETLSGSCHCGTVRFEAEADLEAGTMHCNCSICRKTRFWLAFVPADEFRLLQGEEQLADYRFGAERIRHRFSSRCGVNPFGQSADGKGVAVNIASLDNVAPEQLATLPVRYVDGAHDRWDAAPAVTAHL